MFNLSDDEIDAYIKEDLPFFDLTTFLQEKNNQKASLEIFTREDIVISCTEEAKKIAKKLGCKVVKFKKSGEKAKAKEVFFKIKGNYENIHQAWKLCQVLLEYTCKISTYTNKMLSLAQEVNQTCGVFGTRKTFPLSKRLCIKALIAGGGYPHRLGLSESILFFPQHRAIYKNDDEFFNEVSKLKYKMPEKKFVIETSSFTDAKKAFRAKADVLQLDKVNLETTKKIVDFKNKNFPEVKIISAGGINLTNAKNYALLGIDGIITSSMYLCGMADISSIIKKI